MQPKKAHPEYVAAMLAHGDDDKDVVMTYTQGPGCAVRIEKVGACHA